MQMKKKGRREVSRDHASQRVSRSKKRYSENTVTAEKKVSELITSSIRRQRGFKFPCLFNQFLAILYVQLYPATFLSLFKMQFPAIVAMAEFS